jgi:hypothetical protein
LAHYVKGHCEHPQGARQSLTNAEIATLPPHAALGASAHRDDVGVSLDLGSSHLQMLSRISSSMPSITDRKPQQPE